MDGECVVVFRMQNQCYSLVQTMTFRLGSNKWKGIIHILYSLICIICMQSVLSEAWKFWQVEMINLLASQNQLQQ